MSLLSSVVIGAILKEEDTGLGSFTELGPHPAPAFACFVQLNRKIGAVLVSVAGKMKHDHRFAIRRSPLEHVTCRPSSSPVPAPQNDQRQPEAACEERKRGGMPEGIGTVEHGRNARAQRSQHSRSEERRVGKECRTRRTRNRGTK